MQAKMFALSPYLSLLKSRKIIHTVYEGMNLHTKFHIPICNVSSVAFIKRKMNVTSLGWWCFT